MPDYGDIYPRIAKLLREAGTGLQDEDLDDEIGLVVRAKLKPYLAQGQTWQTFFGELSEDDSSVFNQAVALIVAADEYPTLVLSGGGIVTSLQLGDQKESYSSSSEGDISTLVVGWRRKAASLLASLSFVPPRKTPGLFSGANGPSRQRWSRCRE
jgi:hypothetical protein